MALPLIIVTGVSGAGRTTALKALEDLGYQTIDNLPLMMIPALVDHILSNPIDQSPVVVGLRSNDLNTLEIEGILEILHSNPRLDARIVYLECAQEKVLQRYNESRRPHPFDAKNLKIAILQEQELLKPFKKFAEMQLDTSDLSIRHLRRILQHYFASNQEKGLKIQIISFSYKQGTPRFADLILDMRFLSNPFYDVNLRHLSGKDKKVQHYIQQDQRWKIVDYHFREFLINAIDGYKEQGRSYLTIAFGCTGGQHRSVFVAEFFYKILQKMHYSCIIEHCDLRTKKL